MKKIICITTLLFLLFSCSFGPKNNLELRNKINSMSNMKTVYVIELDSFQKYKDTLSIEKFKKNKKGKKVYLEKLSFSGSDTITISSYYRNNGDLFFEKAKNSNLGIVSIFESWSKDNEIEREISVAYEDNKVKDTVFIEYDRSQRDLNSKTIVRSTYKGETGNQTELFYNDSDLLVSEVFIMKSDTLSVTDYKYLGKELVEKTINDYSNSVFRVLKYNKELLIEQNIYNNNKVKIRLLEYEYDNEGEITKTIMTSYPSNKKNMLLHRTSS